MISNDMKSVGRLLYPIRGRVLVLPLTEGTRQSLLPQGKEVASMRRFLLVLAVAALLAVMMVAMASPAFARQHTSPGNSSTPTSDATEWKEYYGCWGWGCRR